MHGSSILKIVIAYQDYAAGVHAVEMSERLAQQFESEVEIDRRIWSFTALDDPRLREEASAAAAVADMLIVSGSDLPAGAKSWIREWLELKKEDPAALVALPGGDRSLTRDSMITQLRNATENSGIDFFCEADELPVTPPAYLPWGVERESEVLSTARPRL